MLNLIVGKDILLVPQKRVVRAMNNAFTPFGWSQYRQYNKGNVFEEIIKNPVTIVTEPLKALDREVIQPIYREVIQPVGHALEKIGQGIAKDPVTFIAQAAAIAAAPFTAGQSLWALPVISAASTAAKGGSLDQILTATAISAATAAVGGGFGLENSVGGLITNGLQTGVNAAGQATFSIAGMSISASTASAIATAGQGLAMGAIAAGGAAAQGKDPFQAALPSLVGSALGFAGNQLAQAQFFAPVTDALNSISQSVSPIVSKAMTGVASAMITGAITGKDMSQVALMSLANTAVSGVVSASNIVADFFRNDQGGITNMGAATQSIVADLLGSVAATIASGGKVGTEMGAQFLANATKTLVPFLNPEFDAMATNVQLTYKDAESKVKAVNDAATAQQGWVNKYNSDADRVNKLAEEVNSLLSKRDQVYNAYNAATTQSEVDRLKLEFKSIESQISAKTNEYNALYDTLDDTNAAYLSSVKNTEAAQKAYFEVSKTLGDLGTKLSGKMNEASKALTKVAVEQIDPNFNAEEYKALNNLGPAVDAYTHYMSAGKDQGLFTNYADAEPQREALIDKATATIFRGQGWGSIANVPQDVYEATRNRIANFYGKDMVGLQSFTVDNLVKQSKMPATWFAPMWDENTKTVTDAKVLFNGGEQGQVVIADTVLPEGMSVATFYDIKNGYADVTRGSDGKFYWTTNTGAQARILDKQTGEIVQTTYSNYFADKDVPAGATNITRDEQGRVTGYTSKEGVLSVVVRGANNDQAEYKDFGTKFDDVDPFVQMSTYANVTDGIAANFNIKGVVQASKDIVDYMQKGATDLQKLQIATIVKSGGSVLQDVGTVLQDLSVTIGLSKTGETGTLASLGKQLESLANAKTPEQYQAAMKDIEAMRKAAQGTDIIGVNKAIAEKYPDLVGVSVFGGELFEEFIQSGLGKATGAAAGALALTLGAPAAVTAAIAGVAGYGASMALDYAESYRGAKEDMYTRMYDVYKDKGFSDAQAAQMAEAAASKAGVVNGMITLAVNGIAPGDLNKVLFGGKANPAQQAMMDYFLDKVKTAGAVAASEFGQGLVEGTLQGAYNESLVYSVDPSKADYWKGIADSAMLESFIGAPVSAGTYGASVGVEAITKTFTLANEQFTKAIESGNIYTVGELGSVFKQWGVPSSVSMQIVPDIIETNPNLLNAYTTPAELTSALQKSFGFDAAQSADIANIKFNDKITTTQEAKDALFKAGLTGVTDQDALSAGVVGLTSADSSNKISTYANQQMVSEAEVRAAAQQENYDVTQEELSKLVGRGVQADVIAKFVAEVDPKAVTTAEATQYFLDQGYTKARAQDIAQFVKSAPEEQMKQAVAEWVNPRQVTRSEALQFFSDIGYVPTEQEITQFVVQGPEVFQDAIKTQLGEYVDPRYVDAAEVREAFKKMGLNAPVAASDVLRLSGQYAETELAGKAKEALPIVSANAVYALMAGEPSIVQSVKDELLNRIESYKNLGLSESEANKAAIQAVSSQLGTTKNNLLTAIGATEQNLLIKISDTEANLAAKIEEYRSQGLTQQAATQKALNEMATSLGTTKEDLLSKIGATEENLYTQISGVRQELLDKINLYQLQGLTQQAATQKALDELSSSLGTTKESLLQQIGATETNLLSKLGEYQAQTAEKFVGIETNIAATKQSILNQMAAYEKAGIDRDTALDLAISGVSQNLGTTKAELLGQMGTTEANLRAELTQQGAQLTGQIQGVRDLVGRPSQQVSAADATTIQGMIAGTTPVNLAYDTNNDGKVDQTDLTAVQNQLALQQNQNIQQQIDPETGLKVWVDTKTGQPISAQPPALGGQWAPTGIYAALQQQEARQAEVAKAQAAQAKQAQQKNQFGQLMNMIFSAPDVAGQQVTVKTPDPSRIGYIYDWSSIFATPAQASLMPSPYGPMNTVAPQQQKQASNQPLFQFASGFAEGGIVGGNDINVGDGGSVDDLINLLKGNSG